MKRGGGNDGERFTECGNESRRGGERGWRSSFIAIRFLNTTGGWMVITVYHYYREPSRHRSDQGRTPKNLEIHTTLCASDSKPRTPVTASEDTPPVTVVLAMK